jgi:hypothetical protein
MKILCIAASNVENRRDNSASTRACQEVRSILLEELHVPAEVNILSLLDLEMSPCRMCGGCLNTCRCTRDPAFNQVFEQICACDALFFVCPHYAPFPSKVMMLLEKMQEMVFLNGCQDEKFLFPQAGIPLGLIVHGGQKAPALPYYRDAFLAPLASAFASCGFQLTGGEEGWSNGAAFTIKNLTIQPGEVFCSIEHDWPEIRAGLRPLVGHVYSAAQQRLQVC